MLLAPGKHPAIPALSDLDSCARPATQLQRGPSTRRPGHLHCYHGNASNIVKARAPGLAAGMADG